MLHANFMAPCFIEPELMPIEVLHCENGDFRPFCSCDLDFDQITFIYELDPYSLKIYQMCKYELPTSIKAFESYCLTDRQTDKKTDRRDRNYISRRFAGEEEYYHHFISLTNKL